MCIKVRPVDETQKKKEEPTKEEPKKAEMKKDSQEVRKASASYCSRRELLAKAHADYLSLNLAWEFFILPIGEVDVELINSIGFFNLQSMTNEEVLIVDCILCSRKKLPIQILHDNSIFSTYFPGREVPHWFSSKNVGSTISFTMNLSTHFYFRGMNLCLVYTLPSDIHLLPTPLQVEISINGSGTKTVYAPRCYGIPETGGDIVWLSHWVERNLFKEGDEVQIRSEIKGDGQIKECGVHLMYFDEVGEIYHYWNTLRNTWDSNVFEFMPSAGFRTPDKQNLSTPDPNSRGEEDSECLQLEMHQYSDATFGISDHESPSGTAIEGGVSYMEKSMRLNEMGEVVTKG